MGGTLTVHLLFYSLNVASCAYIFCNKSALKRSERWVRAGAHQPPGPRPCLVLTGWRARQQVGRKRWLLPTCTAGHPRGARLRSLHPGTQTEWPEPGVRLGSEVHWGQEAERGGL